MTIQSYGDSAVLIDFEQKIEEDINAEVIALHQALRDASFPEITFYIPAYCSLTVGFDADRITYEELYKKIKSITEHSSADTTQKKSRILNIPVCYDPVFALDMDDISKQTGLSVQEIIKTHTNTTFRVYMLGFLPGFAYMGKLPKALYCSRKPKPRLQVPAQAVGLAGYQTGIYPFEAPGGWQIIGKTPLPLFRAGEEASFLFRPGDRVNFRAISLNDFQHIENDVASGNFNLNTSYE